MYELDSIEVYGQTIEKGEGYEAPGGVFITIEAYEDDAGDMLYYASVSTGYDMVELRAFSGDSPEIAIERLMKHPGAARLARA
jgi:hypothetical protein